MNKDDKSAATQIGIILLGFVLIGIILIAAANLIV